MDLQTADLTLNRLITRRDALPEARTAKQTAADAGEARDRAVLRRTEAGDLQRQVRKLEDEVEKVRARSKRDAELLEGGTVHNARQLTDLQHEIASLKRRQDELEDAELELMEQVEAAVTAQQTAEHERDELLAAAKADKEAADAAMHDLGEQYRATKSERAEMAARIPEELLALYEKIRSDHGGIGVAEFAGDICGGCRLQLPPGDLAAVKAAPVDEVVRCEECRRILVRTSLMAP